MPTPRIIVFQDSESYECHVICNLPYELTILEKNSSNPCDLPTIEFDSLPVDGEWQITEGIECHPADIEFQSVRQHIIDTIDNFNQTVVKENLKEAIEDLSSKIAVEQQELSRLEEKLAEINKVKK
jgi:hypothetical protein